jgi:choline-glycine betaine transporter|tara:strand:+ start:155 stop:280 length:126 start_codon:yes stop_codon:yes gene_type:complete
VALPLIPVLVVLSWSLLRWLKADFSHLNDSQHLIATQPPKR